MIVSIYFLTFTASLAVLIALLLLHKRIITSIVTIAMMVTVSSFGRYLISVSRTLDLAFLGMMFLHLSACFCPLVLIKILAHFCEIKLPGLLIGGLTLLSTTEMLLPLTYPHSHIYYTNVQLVQLEQCSYLVREFGPVRIVYPLMLFIYMGLCIVLLVMALKKSTRTYIHTVVGTVLVVVIIMGFFTLDLLVPNHIDYSIHGYFIAMVLLLWRLERVNMHDLPTNISASIEALNENAYIQFDRKFRVTGVNERVRELFPEIGLTWKIGKKIPPVNSFLYNEIVLWVQNREKGEKKVIHLGEKYYELVVRDIPYMKKACVGYLLAFVDRTSENKYLSTMESYQADLEQEVDKKTEHISHIKDMLVVGIASMIESRDDSTGNHIKRTYAVTQVFAEHLKQHCQELGVTEDFLDMVARAAPMHDLGKIAIDDAVLKKQGMFTDRDYDLMKQHPTEGARIVREILTGVEEPEFVTIAENVAHYHHERWDGTGYPEGLKGEEIPLEARIMALPDVFDALASKRRYKDALPYDVVFPMIEEGLGTHFDARLGKLFIECRPALEEMYRNWYEEDMDNEQLRLTPTRSQKRHAASTNP